MRLAAAAPATPRREPGELVAERDAISSSCASTPEARHSSRYGQSRPAPGASSNQSSARPWRDRHGLEQPPAPRPSRRRTGEDSVANRRGNPFLVDREHLGDEERITTGGRVEPVRSALVPDGRARPRRRTRARSSAIARCRSTRKLADDETDRVIVGRARRHGRWRREEPGGRRSARKEAKTSSVASSAQCMSSRTTIEGARRRARRRVPRRRRWGTRSRLDEFAEVLTDRPGDVCERAEWTRCEERIAGATRTPCASPDARCRRTGRARSCRYQPRRDEDTTPPRRPRPPPAPRAGGRVRPRVRGAVRASARRESRSHADIVASRSEGFKRS